MSIPSTNGSLWHERPSACQSASRSIDNCASTPSAPWPWTPSSRPTPATPARPWPSPRCLHASGSAICATTPRPRLAQPRPVRAVRGHASMLLYSLLHLTGVKAVEQGLRDRSASRRSRSTTSSSSASSTADARATPSTAGRRGVETTTGPLGQGIANSVGMAIAGALAGRPLQPARLRRLFDFNVYALCSDGDMMEGISQRGRLARRPPEALEPLLDLRQQPHHDRGQDRPRLQRGRRRRGSSAYGWNVTRVSDANDLDAARPRRSRRSRRRTDRPTLIIVDSHIACGAPNKQDTHAAHGEPLGEEEIRLTKRSLRLARGRQVPRARRRLRALPAGHRRARQGSCATPGSSRLDEYKAEASRTWPTQLDAIQHRQLPDGWDKDMPDLPRRRQGHGHAATRPARCSTRSPRTSPG